MKNKILGYVCLVIAIMLFIILVLFVNQLIYSGWSNPQAGETVFVLLVSMWTFYAAAEIFGKKEEKSKSDLIIKDFYTIPPEKQRKIKKYLHNNDFGTKADKMLRMLDGG